MSVDAGVPVEAAVEGGMIYFWLYGEGAVGEGDACFVGEFTLHAAEGEFGEVGGGFDSEAGGLRERAGGLCGRAGGLRGHVYGI